MGRIYRIDDGRAVRERQRSLPAGTVAETWPDVFEPGIFWISEITKGLLDGVGGPLMPSAVVDSSRIGIFFPDEPRDELSLPSLDSLRVRVLAGHGIAATWYGPGVHGGGRPLPAPTSPEDAFFYLIRMGSRGNHIWRLFRTREEAVQFMRRNFPDDPKARPWAEGLPVSRYAELLRPHAA